MSDEQQELDLTLIAQMILQGIFTLMLRAGLTEQELSKALSASLGNPTE